MKLTIVIPAYNEEDAIASTIRRCLDARSHIIERSDVDQVEIVVVSDGSTDRTVEIAATFDEVRLVVFERNRGYGAAIKKGFEEGTGDVVGFLDGDGTCDPKFFATLCRALSEEQASVAIGSRMGAQSKMPPIRRLGNRIYALILSALSNKIVSDTASGMRVIRRDVLRHLYPLPDGLHFTPAMSARVLMDRHLTIVERPMTYEERIGESKLHVLSDGVRFLRTILAMTLMWQPARLFFGASVVCLGLMTLLAMHPMEMWWRDGRFDEDMIYRLLFCSLLGTVGVSLLSASAVALNIARLVHSRPTHPSFVEILVEGLYGFGGWFTTALASLPVLIWLIGPGLWSRITDGVVTVHWSRVVLAGLIVFGLIQSMVTVLITNILRYHTQRKPQPYLEFGKKAAVDVTWALPRHRHESPEKEARAVST
ncbi:MAG: glycosyltransferase family 2 protein [Phycisphaerae bacterium]